MTNERDIIDMSDGADRTVVLIARTSYGEARAGDLVRVGLHEARLQTRRDAFGKIGPGALLSAADAQELLALEAQAPDMFHNDAVASEDILQPSVLRGLQQIGRAAETKKPLARKPSDAFARGGITVLDSE